MVFTTFTFAFFLPLALIGYFLLPLRGRQLFLLVASYVFYGWEKPIYTLLLLASTVLDYYCGIRIESASSSLRRKLWLAASLSGNLGMLGFFKYGGFIYENTQWLLHGGHIPDGMSLWHVALPVGISFYTFQTMSYTIQIFRRQIPASRDPFVFALYVSFFPQLVAGPIERADNLLPQLCVKHSPRAEDFREGLKRIVFGFFRKLVLADRFAIFADQVFAAPDQCAAFTAWVGLISFALQIYFDFAGYTDIAIGTARLMGVRLTENFRRPMMAASIADFWSRWHLTLTTWLRDYLFTPLGGFRKGGRRALWAGWLTLLLCGLWHGASWHFVFWGAWHASMMTLYYTWRSWRRRAGGRRGKAAEQPMGLTMAMTMLTFTSTVLSGVLFRSADLAAAGRMFRALTGGFDSAPAVPPLTWIYFALFLAVFVVEYLQEHAQLNERIARAPAAIRTTGLVLAALLTVLLAVNNNKPYIYFQF